MDRKAAKELLKRKMPDSPALRCVDEIIDFLYDHDLCVIGVFDYAKKHREHFDNQKDNQTHRDGEN